MALNSDYLNRLLLDVERGLLAELGGDARVSLIGRVEGLSLDMLVGHRRYEHVVEQAVYHYEPDGSDPSRHASWLVQLFHEEAR